MMWPPDDSPRTWPVYGPHTPPHWAAMTDQGGPTWPEDEGIRRWRERAFGKEKAQSVSDKGDQPSIFGEE